MRTILLTLCILSVTVTAKAQLFARKYKPGYYYNLEGQKITGLLSFEVYRDEIRFKEDKEAKARDISLDQINAVITLEPKKDSLVVLSEDGKNNKRYLGKFIVATPVTKLYYKFKSYSSGGAPTMSYGASPNMGSRGSAPAFTTTMNWSSSAMYSGVQNILMYEENGTTYEINKGNFVETISKTMADNAEIVAQVKAKKLKFKHLDQIMEQYMAGKK